MANEKKKVHRALRHTLVRLSFNLANVSEVYNVSNAVSMSMWRRSINKRTKSFVMHSIMYSVPVILFSTI